MGVISWVILGLIAGGLMKWSMGKSDNRGLLPPLALGVTGAYIGGWLTALLGLTTMAGLSVLSMMTAAIGAFIVLLMYKK